MAKKVGDEDLLDGLQQAKAKPRNYVIVVKGPTVVGMTVNKKKVKPADVQKLRSQSKGNGEFTGVCLRNGPELTLQVVGDVPTLAIPKIREFIEEKTELRLKPQWSVVTAFALVPDELDDEKKPLQPGAKPAATPQTDRLQKCRLLWDSARTNLHVALQSVAKEVQATCANPAEYDPAQVQAGVKKFDRLLETLDTQLIARLDQALNAAQPAEQSTQQEAAVIVQEFMQFVAADKLIAQIDESGLAPTPIRPMMNSVFQQLSAQL